MTPSRAALWLPITLLMATGCSAPAYRLSLPHQPYEPLRVVQRAQRVDFDFPPDHLEGSSLYTTQVILQGSLDPRLPARTKSALKKRRELLYARLSRAPRAWAYATHFEGREALHEFAAGVVRLPLATVLARFTPATEWGRHLKNYRGGALKIDVKDSRGRVIFARERMVLGTPWYAVGAPPLDMSKYEETQYGDDHVTIYWEVRRSANRSVHLDIGYLRFARITPRTTLIFFNSIHRVDPGWGSLLMPGAVVRWLSLAVLRDLFSGHIRKYTALLRRRGK